MSFFIIFDIKKMDTLLKGFNYSWIIQLGQRLDFIR